MNKIKKFPVTKISSFFRDNKLIIFLFLLSTSFFIYQHAVSLGWDFSTYVLNAKYWFADGQYFELLRPPLMPFILGILSVFGWAASEYLFIIAVSALFAYSSWRLARSLKFNAPVFYVLSLNFYLLIFGLINGTELLSLAFLELFIALLIENKSSSGLMLALSSLSRYTALGLFPLILFHLNFKKIIQSLLLFFAALIPWFAYNFIVSGNWFSSIADQYANNILYRDYLMQPAMFWHFKFAINILIPLLAAGLIIVLIRIYYASKNSIAKRGSLISLLQTFKAELVMICILLFSITSYFNIPLKSPRYLFTLLLPAIYFSYIALEYITEKISLLSKNNKKSPQNIKKSIFNKKNILMIIAGIYLLAVFIIAFKSASVNDDPDNKYFSAIGKIKELNLSNCSVQSNSWTKLNYYGLASAPFPWDKTINKSISDGNILVMFNHEPEPEYVFNESFMNSLPIIYKNDEYTIIGTGCAPQKKFTKTYLEQRHDSVLIAQQINLSIDPCIILFHSSKLFEKTCNMVNFNGFRLDDNRGYK